MLILNLINERRLFKSFKLNRIIIIARKILKIWKTLRDWHYTNRVIGLWKLNKNYEILWS